MQILYEFGSFIPCWNKKYVNICVLHWINTAHLSSPSTGLWQPWSAWQGLHLLATVVNWSSDCQGGGVVWKALDIRGDRPDWAHAPGWAYLPHWLAGFCLSQTPQRLCGGQPWNPQETPSCPAQQVRQGTVFLFLNLSHWLLKKPVSSVFSFLVSNCNATVLFSVILTCNSWNWTKYSMHYKPLWHILSFCLALSLGGN